MSNYLGIYQREFKSKKGKQGSLKSRGRIWIPSVLLVLLMCTAVIRVLTGYSPTVMIAGSALAVIIWELSGQIIYRRRDDNSHFLILPKWTHIRLLFTSVGIGLLVAEGGQQVRLSLPFGVVILAVLLILFSVSRFYRLINK